MSALPTYFSDFLRKIRLTENQREDLRKGHSTLRERLRDDEELSDIYVSDFLQGSYRRGTAVRPKSGQRSDVDVIVVTNLDKETKTPHEALELMWSVLTQYYDEDKCKINGRSIGIELSYVDLDVVLTAAPKEVQKEALRSMSVKASESLEDDEDWKLNAYWRPLQERKSLGAQSWAYKALSKPEWKLEPLWIPDRDALCWQRTDPLTQIQKTRDKNKATNQHFINVVKAIKWWRRVKHTEPKYPKGYPLERIVFECCPDGINSMAKGITLTLEGIRTRFAWDVQVGQTPDLRDEGVDPNVLHRIDPSDFAKFYEQALEAAELARQAFDSTDTAESAELWQRLLGSEFPSGPNDESDDEGNKGGGGFSERRDLSLPRDRRFA